MLEGKAGAVVGDVPELDGVVARGTREDVLGSGIEQDMADLSGVTGQLVQGSHVDRLFGVLVKGKVLGDTPEEDLAIVGSRGDEGVVERTPVGVEDSSSVATEQGELFGQLSTLVHRDNSKGTAAASFPIDREVFGVGLYYG